MLLPSAHFVVDPNRNNYVIGTGRRGSCGAGVGSISAPALRFCIEGEEAWREGFVEWREDGVYRGYVNVVGEGEVGFGGLGHGFDDVDVAVRINNKMR